VANSFYLDASALAKRYVPEPGSALVHAVLDTVPSDRIYVLNIGTGEMVSILVRKRNAGLISSTYFAQALANFRAEIVDAADITKMSVTSRLVLGSFPLIVAHAINSTDAITLKSALALARKLRGTGGDLVVVASRPAPAPCRPGRRGQHVRSRNPGSGRSRSPSWPVTSPGSVRTRGMR
jgi:predicted nucleic acid-binding protein